MVKAESVRGASCIWKCTPCRALSGEGSTVTWACQRERGHLWPRPPQRSCLEDLKPICRAKRETMDDAEKPLAEIKFFCLFVFSHLKYYRCDTLWGTDTEHNTESARCWGRFHSCTEEGRGNAPSISSCKRSILVRNEKPTHQ